MEKGNIKKAVALSETTGWKQLCSEYVNSSLFRSPVVSLPPVFLLSVQAGPRTMLVQASREERRSEAAPRRICRYLMRSMRHAKSQVLWQIHIQMPHGKRQSCNSEGLVRGGAPCKRNGSSLIPAFRDVLSGGPKSRHLGSCACLRGSSCTAMTVAGEAAQAKLPAGFIAPLHVKSLQLACIHV